VAGEPGRASRDISTGIRDQFTARYELELVVREKVGSNVSGFAFKHRRLLLRESSMIAALIGLR
jgi:hypothetical protein